MSRNLRLAVLGALLLAVLGAVVFFRAAPAGQTALWQWSGQGTWLLPLLVVSALLDSVNPCAFSILFLTIAFLFSLGQLRSKILTIGLAYIAGLFLVYLLIGLGILGTLHLFSTPHFMSKLGALLLVVLGLIELAGHFYPEFPIKLKIPAAAHGQMAKFIERASMPAAFLLGGLVGLCEFPCTGGPYLMVLGLLHDQGTYLSGFGYLVLYNLIFVLPLGLILGMASERSVLQKVDNWRKEHSSGMRLYSGLGMIILGLLIFAL